MGFLDTIFGNYSKRELARIEPIKQQVLDLETEYSNLSETELKAKTQEFKNRLAEGETLDDILPEALATCREAAFRVLGKKPFPVQIIGAIVLHQGRIAEMKTGEGKTLVACLASYLNALSGKGVHVVTVNDYLAKYQAEEMGKVYRYLGLTIGVILHGLTNDERRAAYNADITYATNNELGFDYLRDNMVIYKKDMVQRAPNFAIVDEVDSILIDEARTPLIISGRGDKSTELYQIVDKFAKKLTSKTVVEIDDKANQEDIMDDCDYIIDEKAKTATITRQGIKKAEKAFNVINLMDADNMTLLHHINQAIKANGIMKRDIDYVVTKNDKGEDEVVIVDEFTGRLMQGRRFNDGLHQAIEAKEGVKVAHESKTLATITFQNYFRLYKKLSGMTGTALTEEDEFREIYKLDVIAVPTNKPVQRIDHPDQIYRTEKGKFEAVIDQIIECNKKGQPVLVGTISIEKSEVLSRMLKARGIKHNVLNAKQHEREAEIVAQAGKLGAVTIATNMAGRGTDIILGGNAEFAAKAELRKKGYDEQMIVDATGFAETSDPDILAARKVYQQLYDKYDKEVKEKAVAVREAGGLFIIGTERHESRRIDNQLRGRSGRQGDCGESRFFLSVEDDLMRIFAGDRLENMMKTLNVEENMPIESKMLTKIIESSQKKVEARNFSIRKNVLNYDDVMSKQRETIYEQRAKVLNGEDLHEYIIKMMKDVIERNVNTYLVDDENKEEWNLSGLRERLIPWAATEDDFKEYYKDKLPEKSEDSDEKETSIYDEEKLEKVSKKDIIDMFTKRVLDAYEAKEKEVGADILRELERVILLKIVDSKWTNHIDDMDELKKGIGLRAYGQRNPVVEYRYEGFEMFDEMIASIQENTVRMLCTVKIAKNNMPQREQLLKPDMPSGQRRRPPVPPRRPAAPTVTVKTDVYRNNKPVLDNDMCPCGSGKKYVNCCKNKQAKG
ncbi:MAG TPA: preprotein translocase subunit SecA [Ruminococcus sp.]|nr:preprotein translocase subunit SecA [Ruminococcus sp.]